jgi:hypothetical protein
MRKTVIMRHYEEDDTRVVERFLWFPMCLFLKFSEAGTHIEYQQWRWLERATIVQNYVYVSVGFGMGLEMKWENTRWEKQHG